MRLTSYISIFLVLSTLLPPPTHGTSNSLRPLQGSSLQIKERNPVVNEGKQFRLTVVDSNGQPVPGVTFESGSPEIASVNPQTGMVTGIERGFATVTARAGSMTASVFVVVARVENGRGAKVPGDAKTDRGGRIYISDPLGSVILRKDGFADPANLFAGQKGSNGRTDGQRLQAQFNAPTAVAVDNTATGGIYIADTANHSIRKIDFKDQVTTVLGMGAPGINTNDVTPFGQAAFKGLQGLATDTGSNLFIVDTENHAIYLADFAKEEVRLLAGEPGMSGKADGRGRAARFTRPAGIALSSDGRSIAVADTGNNSVRLITRDGVVSTIKKASRSSIFSDQQTDDFDAPQSVSFDGVGNIYVVDKSGVKVVTSPLTDKLEIVPLAQEGSFVQAVSVVIQSNKAFVLDNSSDNDAVKVVTVGAPVIDTLSRETASLDGGEEVIIRGKNFAPESQVVVGDGVANNVRVETATTIRFNIPQQQVPGNRTVSVRTRGGVAQKELSIIGKRLQELPDGSITTIAGGVPLLGNGGLAIRASLNSPRVLTVDATGNIIFGDLLNLRVRQVDIQTSIITSVAGNGTKDYTGDGVPATSNGLSATAGVAVDESGNLFISDSGKRQVRRVDRLTGIITTVAGNGDGSFSGDGGKATLTGLSPQGIAVDREGNLLIADAGNNRIRRVDIETGIITTIAGTGAAAFSGDNGPARTASLNIPIALAVDTENNIFFVDSENRRIRRIDAKTAIITTVAGNGDGNFSGDNGSAIAAGLSPLGIAVDGSGNLFIADAGNSRIRRVDSVTGIITTVAGSGDVEFSGDGGPAINAGFDPFAVAVDGVGNLFIADFSNDRIRRVNLQTGIIDTVAGNGAKGFSGDGRMAPSASLDVPQTMVVDGAGNLFIADTGNNRIRQISATTGIITTVAGNGIKGFGGDGGPAIDAFLDSPQSIAVDTAGNLFIADTNNGRIRRVDAGTRSINTIAGGGTSSAEGEPATNSILLRPGGVAVDPAGNILIAETGGNRVRLVDRVSGKITTIAGTGNFGFSGNGGPATAADLAVPQSVAVDKTGNLLIADTLNNCLRRVDARTGIISTVAGGGNSPMDGEMATNARLILPGGAIFDSLGNILIADSGTNRIRKVDTMGIISTIAGSGMRGFSGDNRSAILANLNFPTNVAVDKDGNLYIADRGNDAVRAVKGVARTAPVLMITSASFNKPNLIIRGTGFGSSGARVSINSRDSSSLITNQSDTEISLKGNKKKLNLKKGPNQIVVMVGATTSNTFIFMLNIESEF